MGEKMRPHRGPQKVIDWVQDRVSSSLIHRVFTAPLGSHGDPIGRLAAGSNQCPNSSSSFIHRVFTASLGIRQSPRGDRVSEPTLGPSGRQERLNCWAKKRR